MLPSLPNGNRTSRRFESSYGSAITNVSGRAAIITGAGSGIGAAIAARFLDEGARGLVIADLDVASAQLVAARLGPRALPNRCDVTREVDLETLDKAQERLGPVDIYVSNAGILGPLGGIEVDDVVWDRLWRVHAMAHI